MNEQSLVSDPATAEQSQELSDLDNYSANKSELVFGLVAPVGTDLVSFEELLSSELSKYDYEVNVEKLSKFLESDEGSKASGISIDQTSRFSRYSTLMTAGNKLRELRGDRFLAEIGIYQIASKRTADRENNAMPMSGKVSVLHSIKHSKEVEALREVYEEGFFLIGLHSSKYDRIGFLKRKGISEVDATELIQRDYDDNNNYGQQTSKVFELSDVFISLDSGQRDKTREQIKRFLELLFGYPFHTPTRDENAMFLAYSASLRSGSLARQIGAVVANKVGDIMATGTNDVPRYGGGQYWTEDENDGRDFQKGFDANTIIRNSILTELLDRITIDDSVISKEALGKIQKLSPEAKLALSKKLFKGTALFGLTEYMRDVHAEMEALLTCVRAGISVLEGTIFCTTFPCHNCAKHIIDAGIKRVVYVEAYPKSKAEELHSDSLSIDRNIDGKLFFEPFIGIGPRRYIDLFSLSLGTGRQKIRKDDDGKVTEWSEIESIPRLQMKHISYLEREILIVKSVKKKRAER